MPEPAPLWERREHEQDDSWFHAVKYPFAGIWYPVRWQGLLLLAIQGGLLYFVASGPEGLPFKLPELWQDWFVWSVLGAFVILFAITIVKTRWRWG